MKKYTSYLTLAVSILSLGILITSCGSDSTGTNPSSINGTWHAISNGAKNYVKIDIPNVDTYETHNNQSCYHHDRWKIKKISGDKYVETYVGTGETDTTKIYVQNDRLTLKALDGSTFRYEHSNIDLSQLTLCN